MFFRKLATLRAGGVLALLLMTLACGTNANSSGHGHGTPGFTLKASPSNLSVAQGGSRTSAIKITDQDGFNGSVSLSRVHREQARCL
jgi:hypothetical protein